MSDNQNPITLPAFDIFKKLFQKVFNCSFDGKKTNLDVTKIDRTRLSLLFAWPGIILLKLADLRGSKGSCDKLKKLEALLDNDQDLKEIQNNIEIELKEIQNFLLLFHPKSIHFPQERYCVSLIRIFICTPGTIQ